MPSISNSPVVTAHAGTGAKVVKPRTAAKAAGSIDAADRLADLVLRVGGVNP